MRSPLLVALVAMLGFVGTSIASATTVDTKDPLDLRGNEDLKATTVEVDLGDACFAGIDTGVALPPLPDDVVMPGLLNILAKGGDDRGNGAKIIDDKVLAIG